MRRPSKTIRFGAYGGSRRLPASLAARLGWLVALAMGAGCGNANSSSPGNGAQPPSPAGGGNDASAAAPGGDASTGVNGGSEASAGASSGGDASTGGSGSSSGGGTGATMGGGGADATAGGPSSTDSISTFTNGGFWNDTSGNRIEAHGAGLILSGGVWYWVGEDKSQNSNLFKAVNCYSSTDLATWKFENAIITQSTAPTLATAGRIIERPKVVFNDSTKQFVMWVHFDGNNYAEAMAGVFTSPTVCGNYAYQSSFQPNGNMSRDSTLFKDDDGKAYFISAANNNKDTAIYRLSADYLTVDTQIATVFVGQSREAPAMFKSGGNYFLINSAATGWNPNQQKYAWSSTVQGPYSALANFGDSTAFDTQTAFVIPFVGSQTTTYIYAGDRWMDPDLVSSKYIWLPLTVKGTTVSMDNHATWQLDTITGVWSASGGTGTASNFVPQAGWSLISVDSEETQAEDGHGKNAFDGSSSTFWHTQYTGTTPAHPHEIQIDLGTSYSIKGLSYLPRQDGSTHGMVADYQFYVAQTMGDWGTPVATGTFTSSTSAQMASFPTTTARFIRFVAQSEVNGQPWTSVAELNLVPGP